MLKVDKKKEDNTLMVTLEGKLDTTTAPDFESAITPELKDGLTVIVDMKNLSYISSAGLRVLIVAKKGIGNGSLKVRNVSADIQDVLEITGFSTLLDLED